MMSTKSSPFIIKYIHVRNHEARAAMNCFLHLMLIYTFVRVSTLLIVSSFLLGNLFDTLIVLAYENTLNEEVPVTLNDREMFETYKEQVYRLCRHMLQQQADAEDVCQEVFFKAMIVDRTDIKDIKPWLMRIAVNECNTVLKRRLNGKRKEKLSFLLSLTRPSMKIEEHYEQVEIADEFSAILSKLPDKLRVAVVLRIGNDMSIAETAQVLRVPEGTVKSRVNRGLQMLRSFMKDAPNSMSKGDAWTCTPSVKTK